MKVSRPFSIMVVLSLLLSHCYKRQGGEQTEGPLVQKVWTSFENAERQSQYSERLTGEVLARHSQNTAFIRGKIPSGYPEPYLPYGLLKDSGIDPALVREPALNAAIVALGEKLFFDARLSFSNAHGFDQGISCSSCHQSERFFTDNQALSKGIEGDPTHRNTPTIINAAYNSTLTWMNPVFPILEMQAQIPLFGNDPIEMGLRGKEIDGLDNLFAQDPAYGTLFQKAFQLDTTTDYSTLTTALAAYERTLISFDTKFDRFIQDRLHEDEIYSDAERKGLALFFGFNALASGETLPCAQCHAGFLFTDSSHYVRDDTYFNRKAFHDTGLKGSFRTPPLRFVGQTAPYAHDGSFATLEDVLRHYAAGSQELSVDPLVKSGFSIQNDEIKDIVSFLRTLE